MHRNKIKRWIKEIFQKKSLGDGYAVIVRDDFLQRGYKNISDEFNFALEKFVSMNKNTKA